MTISVCESGDGEKGKVPSWWKSVARHEPRSIFRRNWRWPLRDACRGSALDAAVEVCPPHTDKFKLVRAEQLAPSTVLNSTCSQHIYTPTYWTVSLKQWQCWFKHCKAFHTCIFFSLWWTKSDCRKKVGQAVSMLLLDKWSSATSLKTHRTSLQLHTLFGRLHILTSVFYKFYFWRFSHLSYW